jgi:low affinity Fe/Cu permease
MRLSGYPAAARERPSAEVCLSASKTTQLFTRFSSGIAHAAGKPVTFILACAIIIVWAVSGPVFGFSDTWQLVINTSTTIITFLMVFVIQNTQNRDGKALQAKLDELIRASAAHNTFIGIEHLTEEELAEMQDECKTLAEKEGRELTDHERARVAGRIAGRSAHQRVEKALQG